MNHDDNDSELQRALRTAVRSVEAAQADASSELAIEHLTGAVSQLAFVVGRLTDELTKIKKRGDQSSDGLVSSSRNGEIEQDRDRPSRHSTL